nr:MAG TPA: hypothetical protein [Caudoviricetes sp.]
MILICPRNLGHSYYNTFFLFLCYFLFYSI